MVSSSDMRDTSDQHDEHDHSHPEAEDGATATEYALVLVFISIVAALGMVVLGEGMLALFDDTGTVIDEAEYPQPGTAATGND